MSRRSLTGVRPIGKHRTSIVKKAWARSAVSSATNDSNRTIGQHKRSSRRAPQRSSSVDPDHHLSERRTVCHHPKGVMEILKVEDLADDRPERVGF